MFASVLTPANVAVLATEGAEICEDQAYPEIRKSAQKFVDGLAGEPEAKVAKRDARLPSEAEASMAASAIASSSSAAVSAGPSPHAHREWRDLPTIPDKEWTMADARAKLLVAVGVSLSINKSTSWVVKYLQRPVAPQSRTVSFVPGDAASSSQALREVLAWAWRAHKEATGEDCPFNLGVAV